MKKNTTHESIKVYVRFRPGIGEQTEISKLNSTGDLMIKRDFEKRIFQFNHVFQNTSSQESVINQVAEPVWEAITNGYNGSILAYGQTGTGKTFTMLGNSYDGILPRSLSYILNYINTQNFKNINDNLGLLVSAI